MSEKPEFSTRINKNGILVIETPKPQEPKKPTQVNQPLAPFLSNQEKPVAIPLDLETINYSKIRKIPLIISLIKNSQADSKLLFADGVEILARQKKNTDHPTQWAVGLERIKNFYTYQAVRIHPAGLYRHPQKPKRWVIEISKTNK